MTPITFLNYIRYCMVCVLLTFPAPLLSASIPAPCAIHIKWLDWSYAFSMFLSFYFSAIVVWQVFSFLIPLPHCQANTHSSWDSVQISTPLWCFSWPPSCSRTNLPFFEGFIFLVIIPLCLLWIFLSLCASFANLEDRCHFLFFSISAPKLSCPVNAFWKGK